MQFQFKKSLGQNFLIDNNVISKIINSINSDKDSLIIEVGPGSGALTKELVKLESQVLCFEIDKRLKEYLDKINVTVYYEDFLKTDLKKYLTNYKYNKLIFVANLPYYITTAIINKILEESDVDQMILMVQKEVGNRINAKPNTKEYNSLSVFLQYNFNIEKVAVVSKNSFVPKPKVDSLVLKFTKTNKYNAHNELIFYKLVKDSFKYKRKNLKNNLENYNLSIIEKTLKKFNKNLTYRAESLSIEEFIEISNAIS